MRAVISQLDRLMLTTTACRIIHTVAKRSLICTHNVLAESHRAGPSQAMGIKVPKTVADYPSFGLDLGIVCDACGRTAVFKASDVDAFFSLRRIPTRIPLNTSIFTCKCGNQKVRAIGVEVGRRPSPHESYGRLLHPIYVIPPTKR